MSMCTAFHSTVGKVFQINFVKIVVKVHDEAVFYDFGMCDIVEFWTKNNGFRKYPEINCFLSFVQSTTLCIDLNDNECGGDGEKKKVQSNLHAMHLKVR